jgi:DNA-binding MarR family transcriptional regulator
MSGEAGSKFDQRAQPSLIYVIGRVSQGIRRSLREQLRAYELSVSDVTTLSVLRGRTGLSNAQLARRALVSPQSMIEVLASLERRGLVVRHADAANARIMRAELTERGRATLDRADAAIASLEAELLDGVDPPQREAVRAALIVVMRELSAGFRSAAPTGARRSP